MALQKEDGFKKTCCSVLVLTGRFLSFLGAFSKLLSLEVLSARRFESPFRGAELLVGLPLLLHLLQGHQALALLLRAPLLASGGFGGGF